MTSTATVDRRTALHALWQTAHEPVPRHELTAADPVHLHAVAGAAARIIQTDVADPHLINGLLDHFANPSQIARWRSSPETELLTMVEILLTAEMNPATLLAALDAGHPLNVAVLAAATGMPPGEAADPIDLDAIRLLLALRGRPLRLINTVTHLIAEVISPELDRKGDLNAESLRALAALRGATC